MIDIFETQCKIFLFGLTILWIFSISDSENKLYSHNRLQPSNQHRVDPTAAFRIEIEFSDFRISLAHKSYPNP